MADKAAKCNSDAWTKLKYTVLRKLYPTLAQAEAIARVDRPPIRKNSTVNSDEKEVSLKSKHCYDVKV